MHWISKVGQGQGGSDPDSGSGRLHGRGPLIIDL